MTVGRIPSVEGGIQPTLLDAKGDLIAASAADTPQRLAVGTNGQVLTANSAQSTGLEWKTQATYSTYTPTLKQSNTVTFTNQNGGYAEIGNFVHWYGRINITGTGTSANSIYLDGLPVNWAAGVNPEYTGIAQFYDASAGLTYYANAFFLSSAYTLYLAGLSTFQGFLGQTGSPFSGAIDTGDVIWWDVTYRKA